VIDTFPKNIDEDLTQISIEEKYIAEEIRKILESMQNNIAKKADEFFRKSVRDAKHFDEMKKLLVALLVVFALVIFAVAIFVIVGLWVLYRITRGWLRLIDRLEMPRPE